MWYIFSRVLGAEFEKQNHVYQMSVCSGTDVARYGDQLWTEPYLPTQVIVEVTTLSASEQ
jgi:hypothetical protein